MSRQDSISITFAGAGDPLPHVRVAREPLFDIAKLIVMLFVVRGHLYSQLMQGSPPPTILTNIYALTGMPLYFMISGYFAYKHLSDYGELLLKSVMLVWPLFSFGVVFCVVEMLTGNPSFSGLKELFFPIWRVSAGSWFLRTLANLFC